MFLLQVPFFKVALALIPVVFVTGVWDGANMGTKKANIKNTQRGRAMRRFGVQRIHLISSEHRATRIGWSSNNRRDVHHMQVGSQDRHWLFSF